MVRAARKPLISLSNSAPIREFESLIYHSADKSKFHARIGFNCGLPEFPESAETVALVNSRGQRCADSVRQQTGSRATSGCSA